MIALGFLGVMVFFGDTLASRWFSFVSLPHRLATAFLVGLLTGTWISYLAALLASGASDPMAVGGLASGLGMLLAGIWLRRNPSSVAATPANRLRSIRSEWALVLLLAAAAGAMMIWTYHYDHGTLWIAGDLWSDFGPTSAISQSTWWLRCTVAASRGPPVGLANTRPRSRHRSPASRRSMRWRAW